MHGEGVMQRMREGSRATAALPMRGREGPTDGAHRARLRSAFSIQSLQEAKGAAASTVLTTEISPRGADLTRSARDDGYSKYTDKFYWQIHSLCATALYLTSARRFFTEE